MQIVRKRTDDVVEMQVAGRLDGYWCDHLTGALSEAIREGSHHIRVDCTQVTFLSSAGVSALVKCYRELARINGTFRVVNPSERVSTVLRLTRLDTLLVMPAGEVVATPIRARPATRIDIGSAALEVFELDPVARLTCRAIGSPAPLVEGAFTEEHCTTFESIKPALGLGIGAFGGSFSECRARFGELISVAGATAYQPGDGTNVADYLLRTGDVGSDIHLLYGLVCEGPFSHLVRFDAVDRGVTIGLSALLSACLEATQAGSLGVVVVAETTGLLGAALRRSPTRPPDDGGFFSHPGVRTRLSFTAERAFRGSLALVAGVVTRVKGSDQMPSGQLRRVAPDVLGHVHAAAFRFRPLRKTMTNLDETVAELFEPDQLLGVLHLLNDDRGASGAGESEFVTGACWIGQIAGDRAA